MKLIKRTLFLIIASVLLLLVYLMFANKDYIYSNTVTVQGEIDEVYNSLKFLKNQGAIYIDGEGQAQEVHKSIVGEDGTFGAKCIWTCGNKYMQECTQVISELNYPETIQIDMVNAKPYNLSGTQRYELIKMPEGTKIEFKGSMHFPFPYNIVLLLPSAKNKIDAGLDAHLNDLSNQFKL